MKKSSVKNTLREQQLAPKKRFGQNFLVHQQTADRIAELAEIRDTDTVIEVGVGLGALTTPLARRAQQVIGLEIDRGIIRLHEEQQNLPPNVSLVAGDVLKVDFAELATRSPNGLIFVANLPYSISNPFLFRLFEHHHLLAKAVIMLQREVADRICAKPGNKAYGILSILLGSCASVTRLLNLGPEQFHPRPKVDSQVIRLDFKPVPAAVAALPPHSPALLRKIVNGAFQQRRKTLVNGLLPVLQEMSKDDIATLLIQTGLSPTARPETLSVRDWIDLCNLIDQAS